MANELNGRALSADDILKAPDLRTQKLEVPEWGGHVYVRLMTGTERDEFEQEFVDLRTGKRGGSVKNIRAKFAARVMSDKDGRRLFTDKQIDQLGQKSAAALDRVFDMGLRLNGLAESDVQELAGN